MRIVVLKTLPQGQQPNTIVDLPEPAARLFIQIQAARELTEEEALGQQTPPATPPKISGGGRHRRRDMRAHA